jgi:hypothetical protein
VKGRIVTGAGAEDRYTFLDQSSVLWSKSMGNPVNPRSHRQGDYNGKLRGEYVWPISISLPKSVSLPNGSGGGCQEYRLPQTFVEPNTRASIEYSFTVRISRSKLRSDNMYASQSSSLRASTLKAGLQIEHKLCLCTFHQTRSTVISPSTRLSRKYSPVRTRS